MPSKHTLEKVESPCLCPQSILHIEGTNEWMWTSGEKCYRVSKRWPCHSAQKALLFSKWLITKAVTALAVMGSYCTDYQLGKQNRKNSKELWVKHCHHHSFNHLWTIGFSIRLEANWGKIRVHFTMDRFLSCCLGGSKVIRETEIRRPGSCFSTNRLSGLKTLNVGTFLFFLWKQQRTRWTLS